MYILHLRAEKLEGILIFIACLCYKGTKSSLLSVNVKDIVRLPGVRLRGRDNHRLFLENLAQNLKITDKEGFYSISSKTVKQYGGSNVLRQYGGSRSRLLESIFPEYLEHIDKDSTWPSFLIYKWDKTKFSTVPRKHWNTIANQRSFLDNIAKQLNITDPQGWVKVPKKVLQELGGHTLLTRYHSMSKLLMTVYPEYKQSCRDFVMSVVHELKLKSVEDVLKVPLEYPHLLDSSVVLLSQGSLWLNKTTEESKR